MKTAHRKHKINEVIKSNFDLSVYSNSRVYIMPISEGLYKIESKLKFFACETGIFPYRFIKSMAKNRKISICGNCSRPTAINIY